PRRDEEFYCRDVVFQVEDILFKVSRRPFEEDSEGFASMFALPPTDHPSGVEGTSDANPIHLPVTEDEFRALLHVIFPTSFTTRALTKDNWMSVLKLADMWGFDDVRDKAIAELRRLIPGSAERVRIARRFGIAGWVEPALKELVQQDMLSAGDLEALGWDMAARLIQIRENVQFSGNCTCGCNYCSIAH
ncbi:uncharacterized protein TRAVEDRAFT_104976, partial [Trametes versicolor FP-101664 SS1]|uniref:uncharacterized protein n=1 Tax=Trametes versicolor (strain FP-101664) TaxID=717944 RepID=UPI00046248AE